MRRLEEIKKKIKLPVTWGTFNEADRDWLISEVERLMEALERIAKNVYPGDAPMIAKKALAAQDEGE